MTDTQKNGYVFNIQKFSVHDGKGIRTLVFLKGCPLRCRWCSNPESQKLLPEHAFNPMRCLTASVCGRCIRACPTGALSLDGEIIHYRPELCQQCFACAGKCPTEAQSVYGQSMTVGQVLDKVEEDEMFYHRSGGGMTLSGGECLAQPEFAIALLREAKHRSLNTAIETCGFYPYERLEEACRHLDQLIYDIKCFDPAMHKKQTGADNSLILENFMRVCEDFPKLRIRARTPVIPGINDSEREIRAIRDFIPRKPNVEYELLTYHRMGQPKYGYLGRVYEMMDARLEESVMSRLRSLIE